MKTYQYDTQGDILYELYEIKKLLKIVAGVDSLDDYMREKEMIDELSRLEEE
jgi:hypothetical protein